MNKSLSELLKKYYKIQGDKNEIFTEIIQACQIKINKNQSKFYFLDEDDVSQESKIKIFNMLEKHKLDKFINKSNGEILSYIQRSIDNAVKDVLKKNYKFLGIETSVLFDENKLCIGEEFSDFRIILEESFERLTKNLTKKQKQVVRLLSLEDLSETQVAEMLDVRRQTINAIKKRAKKTLEVSLTQNINGAGKTPLCTAI